MSGIFQDIFGGSSNKSQSQSQSGNNAYPWVSSTFEPGAASAFSGGTSALEGLLGLGPPGQSASALNNFWNSTGGNFLLNQGTQAINDNMYARELGESGADMKALEDYRQGLASTKLNDLMQNYLGLAKLGLGAGDLVSNAGQYSQSSSSGSGSSSTGNAGKALGTVLSMIPFI